MKHRLGRIASVAGMVMAITTVAPGAHSAPWGQTASATDGTYAYGGSGEPIRFADGRSRYFAVMFAIPRGTVAGSPMMGSADLTKPWAAVSVQGETATGGGLVGSREVCHEFINPETWSAGNFGAPNGWGEPTYGGVSFSVSCRNDGSYRSFTFTFNPSFIASKGDMFGVHQYSRPEPDPQLWGWAVQNGDANGFLEGNRKNVQPARMTVCAVRVNGERECVTNPGSVSVIVPTAAFSSQVYSVN